MIILKKMVMATVLAGTIALNAVCFAEEDIKISVDNKAVEFDVKPMVIQDRTMAPMKAIFEALGAKVSWDEKTQTVTGTKGTKRIELTLGSTEAVVDGKKQTLDAPAIEVDGRTLVPLRFISESLGVAVRWDKETNTAVIDSNILYGKLNCFGEGVYYIGDYINELPNGYGKLCAEDGTIKCEGQWVDGVPNGQIVLYYDNGNVAYEGECKNKIFHGFGSAYSDNGTLMYEGSFKDGLRDGKGKTYTDKGFLLYDGDFVNGKMKGYGKIYNKDGMVIYDGQWLDNKMHGLGKLYSDEGTIIYEGNFKNGKLEGKGRLYDAQGKVTYEGEFKDGLPL